MLCSKLLQLRLFLLLLRMYGKPAAPDRIRHTPLVAAYFFDGSVEAVSALANGTAGSHLSQMMRPSVSGLMGAVAGCVLRARTGVVA